MLYYGTRNVLKNVTTVGKRPLVSLVFSNFSAQYILSLLVT